MTTTRLSPLDHAFWSLESPDAPMHIGALAVFGPGPAGAVDPYAVAALLAERAQRVPRLRRRVRAARLPWEAPTWEEQPDFDATAHIVRHELPADSAAHPADPAFGRFVGELMARPVARHRPPWEIHLIGAGRGAGRGTGGDQDAALVLLLKVHHAVVDGLRALELGIRLLDGFGDAPAAGARRTRAPERSGAREPLPASDGPTPLRLLRSLRVSLPVEVRRTWRATEIAGSAVLAAADGVERALLHPSPLRPSLLRAAAQRPAPTASGAGLALPTVALDDARLIRKAHGGTVNDVVLAVLAGALRGAGERTDVRVLVPVSERGRRGGPGSGVAATGNRLSGFLVDLPVSEPDPVLRLRRVREAMDAHKAAGPRRGAGAVALLADLVPAAALPVAAPLLRPSAGLLFDSLVTNVPVPDLSFTLAGLPLTALHPLAPLARHQELAVAVSSYRGRLHLGLRGRFATDALCAAVDAAVADLLATT
ncbi:diacylglycerol O-acyltransferase [Streptacidiphilus sp. MAP12-33]|uniref:wax ester/triacylglycerol synthase domain-containing protein n=1 Tax=Streptacidiphilus sp. MAP12-33 TaxID=3156266 RepID=UPI003517C485